MSLLLPLPTTNTVWGRVCISRGGASGATTPRHHLASPRLLHSSRWRKNGMRMSGRLQSGMKRPSVWRQKSPQSPPLK
ncbi:hypothetical protein E2C01_034849 [Portunus trituberculatus]|uniref:Uncharacterized protein n=1 Tax=Portunus trituberculatus TaxID=210409 RepID=A0A5B7F2K9_PORTR|nr:hypothetical protein [Portunus trituberculatus]